MDEFDTPRGYFDNTALTEEALRQVMALYYTTITQLDFQLGRVLRRLREIGAYDNTLIVFTSDHGEYLGFHHLLLKTGPMYDPVVRVPLIVKRPGQVAAGFVDDRLVSGVDVVPTALAWLGLRAGDLPGHDLADGSWQRNAVVAESKSEGYLVRTARHKLLARPGRPEVVFDLRGDPLELQRHATGMPVDAHLRAELDAVLRLGSPSGGAAPRGTVRGPRRTRIGGHDSMRCWAADTCGSTARAAMSLGHSGSQKDETQRPLT